MAQTLLTPVQVDALVAAYAAGEKISALAPRLGIHRNTVTAHLRRRGARQRRGLSPQQAAQAVVLYVKQERTLEEIGREFGVSQRTVGRIMAEAGMPRPSARPRQGHRRGAPWAC